MDEAPVANPGSTLGEAVGAALEKGVNQLLRPIAEEYGCVYVSVGPTNLRTGRPTKLLLKDAVGNTFNIDSIIANERLQPLVLIESKYIRYTKHNRDKGSWICTAHYSLRRTFPTIRKSIAVLAGNWSASSKAMMESFDVSLFEIGFSKIVDTLGEFGVDFQWEEKERDKAYKAWQRWKQLDDAQYQEIAYKLLSGVESALRLSLKDTLDIEKPREIIQVEVIIETNLGESRSYIFESIEGALAFLQEFDEQKLLNDGDGPPLWNTSMTP